MIPIFIASVSPFSGKNLVCIGLGQRFKKDGYNTGYFKPVGFSPIMVDDVLTDEDANFLSRALKVNEPLQSICPVVLTDDLMKNLITGEDLNIRQKTLSAFEIASQGKDIMISRGIGRLSGGTCLGFSELDFINELNARVIFVDKFGLFVEMLDGFLYAKKMLKDKLLGVIINIVPPDKLEYIKEMVVPFLKNNGIETLGIIQKDPVLGAITIKEIISALNGKILCCEEKADELIRHFMIGAMNTESAMQYFRKVPDKAVITGGDRSDIQLAALETSTKCLILTGGLSPSVSILGRACDANVPVVVVSADTATTMEICESLANNVHLHSQYKIQRATDIIDQNVNFSHIYNYLGLPV